MDAFDAENLKALLAALAPGLIILGIRQCFVAGPTPSFQDRALAYAGISAVYYAISTPIIAYLQDQFGLLPWFGDALEYLIMPILVGGVLAVSVSQDWIVGLLWRFGLRPVHHIPAAWDYAFSRLRGETYVIVTLTDGAQVAGHYGQGSFASSNEHERDLLIEDVWNVNEDGPWTRPAIPRSVLLCGRDIRSVELLRME